MDVSEFHDSVLKLDCLSDISDFHTLNQIYLRNVSRGAFGWYELEQDSPEQRVWLGLHLFWVGQNMFALLRPRGWSRPSCFIFSQ